MLEKIEPICQNICVPVAASFISLPLVFFQN
jgi:DsbC/DsbD-like thiol-disulfide interchange protein